ncbi:uncharacterized protein LOC122030450 [Zingiber officinale]|uniref:Myb/SANT-like DNA-binding domain-containing protein n=1 Tax=Zingiber officinale TaxID=94328 RepID=A0A8J5C4R0_ZINOF|nr:uncharacterized protein LOC122030450 [Zingiber officinale]KAG6472678.1 hypothetical protein ZIOFF_070153 [Zingiber officinale]
MDNSMLGGGLFPSSVAGNLDLDPYVNHHLHFHPGLDYGGQMSSLFAPSSAGVATSDDEDHFHASDENGHDPRSLPDSRGKKVSPWHRMKWTDEVVRLLISVVACVGDHEDGAVDSLAARKKHGASFQKKGKWKTVSKLMLEKDCYVSPQQCEDKFNDLNKRYKRLNEILGWGTSCQVVENLPLLDSMPHLSPKAKDDARKILSSKHLFYQEMCAYHNGQRIPSCHDVDLHVSQVPKVTSVRDGRGNVEDEGEDEDKEDDNDEEREEMGKWEVEKFRLEIDAVLHDTTRSSWEHREWFKRRALMLKEGRIEIEAEALELEKQHFKWQRFRSKKDRELKRLRLENERLKLENEHMILQVRMELDLGSGRLREPLSSSRLVAEREQVRDPMELAMSH